jgi:polyisoprenoid-binding protein YceI
MKKLIFSLCIAVLAIGAVSAQGKLFTRDAKVYFNATAENSPETIEAAHTGGTFVFDKSNGRLEMAVLIKGFYFERALMQEHFNENYMESSKFPKANFKGALTDLSAVNFAADGTYNANVSGQLTIHGVTQTVSTPVQFIIAGGAVSATCNFSVTLKDYGIEIPSLVSDKVGKVARISIKVENLQTI